MLFLTAVRNGAAVAEETRSLEADKNNTLIESPEGSLSNGKGPAIFVGRTGQPAGSIRRGLIRFDIGGALRAGSKITFAKLSMYVTMSAGGTTPASVELHRAMQNWGEGDSNSAGGRGAPATEGDATWIHTLYPNKRWSQAGGHFQSSPSAVAPVAGNGAFTWTDPQMVSDVQAWLDHPKNNFGWFILGDETRPATARVFASRHSPDADSRPHLTLTFIPPKR
jgi:hypothetical protein